MEFKTFRRAECRDDLRRCNERLDLLAAGARDLLSGESTGQMVQSFCEQVMAHLDCHVFSGFLSDPDHARMHLAASAGMPEEGLEAVRCPDPAMDPRSCLHRPGCQRSACSGHRSTERRYKALRDAGVRAYACHPLVYRGRNIGILSFGTGTRSRFSEEDLDLMRAVADLVAAAVARSRDEAALAASEERLRLTLEGAGAGVGEVNVATGEVFWSPEQYELHGIEPGAGPLTLAHWEGALHPGDRLAARAWFRKILAGQETRYRREWRIVHPRRGIRWILAIGTVARAGDQGAQQVRGINIDITERKEWEGELERRVAERTAELLAANKELEGFTYAASHDMKAPLGRISNFSTLLGNQYRDRLEGNGLLFLDFIQQNALRLHSLVEDLLAHAHIGHQPLWLQTMDARAAVQAVIQERNEEIRQKGADICLDFPQALPVHCNPARFSQVLRNLIDNALKYSARNRPPVIEIGGCLRGAHCRLWVRDNGIGLDMGYKDRIFEIFRRLHTYSEYPGHGIGLSLVKKAMDRMGGQVWVESEPGRGATFFLELPAGRERSPSPAQDPILEGPGPSRPG